jgi:monoamine oxidase
MHDWQQDPFSRGAYSYASVGGFDAAKALAAPVADTLYFAGEATNCNGYNGTVHGAMASGDRAARELLQSMGVRPQRTA